MQNLKKKNAVVRMLIVFALFTFVFNVGQANATSIFADLISIMNDMLNKCKRNYERDMMRCGVGSIPPEQIEEFKRCRAQAALAKDECDDVKLIPMRIKKNKQAQKIASRREKGLDRCAASHAKCMTKCQKNYAKNKDNAKWNKCYGKCQKAVEKCDNKVQAKEIKQLEKLNKKYTKKEKKAVRK